MKTIEISAVSRNEFGKKESNRLKREGFVPCVIYGGKENIHLAIDDKQMKSLIYTPNSYIIDIDIDGKKETVVIREVQFHPVTDKAIHADFFRVAEGENVIIDIPITLFGNSEGVKMGGKLMLSKRKLKVSAKLEELPDTLDIDVTALELGKSIMVGDVSIPNVTILNSPSTPICAVKMTRAARGAAAAAASGK